MAGNKTYMLVIKEDGISTEIITTNSVEIVDGVLGIDGREIKITDRFCMEVE